MRPLAWLVLAALALPLASAYALPAPWSASAAVDGACAGLLDASAVGPVRGAWLLRLDLRSGGCGDASVHEGWVEWDPRWDGAHLLRLDEKSGAFLAFGRDAGGARTVELTLWDADEGERVLAGTLHERSL